MSLENVEEDKNYGSDEPSLRELAKQVSPHQDEPTVVEISDDAPAAELTVKEAGAELTKHKQRQADEQSAIRAALGEGVPEPSETERLESRVRELEASRHSVDVDQSYREGAQRLQEAHQAQAEVETYRQQLADNFETQFGIPVGQTMDELGENIKLLASIDQEKATEAVQYLMQAEQAVRTAQEAVVGRHTVANQAIAVWAQDQDRQFLELMPELKNEAARAKVGEAAREVLKSTGMTDEQIAYQWNSGQLRSAQAQKVLALAGRAHLGEKMAKKATPKVPKVLRPGQGGSRGQSDTMRALDRKLTETGDPRSAARLFDLRGKRR